MNKSDVIQGKPTLTYYLYINTGIVKGGKVYLLPWRIALRFLIISLYNKFQSILVLFHLGGETPNGELLSTCESYEPLTDDWHKEERLLGSRKDHACVATDDAIYLSGGASKAEPYSDHIW